MEIQMVTDGRRSMGYFWKPVLTVVLVLQETDTKTKVSKPTFIKFG